MPQPIRTPEDIFRADPRFQCYQLPYQVNHVPPEGPNGSHPAKVRDLWANACLQWPELQKLQLNALNLGQVIFKEHERNWCLLWNEPLRQMLRATDAHWRSVADWLRLPADADIASEW